MQTKPFVVEVHCVNPAAARKELDEQLARLQIACQLEATERPFSLVLEFRGLQVSEQVVFNVLAQMEAQTRVRVLRDAPAAAQGLPLFWRANALVFLCLLLVCAADRLHLV